MTSKPKLNQPDVETTTTKPIIETQCTFYSKYPLKNYKINFKEQEEQKIFKEFEEKGYNITKKIAYGQLFVIEKGYSLVVYVYKTKKEYKTMLGEISTELHQLLHRLFEIWGWLE